MTCEELCRLLGDFQDRTVTVRGRRVNQGLIFLSLDSDGRGQLQAVLEGPGHGTLTGVVEAARGLSTGRDQAKAEFLSLVELERLLRGEQPPAWYFGDEDRP